MQHHLFQILNHLLPGSRFKAKTLVLRCEECEGMIFFVRSQVVMCWAESKQGHKKDTIYEYIWILLMHALLALESFLINYLIFNIIMAVVLLI